MKTTALKFFAASCLLISSYNANAICRSSYRWNGSVDPSDGKTKYEKIEENDLHTELNCSNPGSNICKWKDGTVAPKVVVGGTTMEWGDIEAYIGGQIALGQLNGSVTGDGGLGSFSWNATTPTDFSMTVCD